jgi:hypothetical protein
LSLTIKIKGEAVTAEKVFKIWLSAMLAWRVVKDSEKANLQLGAFGDVK